ncbi:MAG: hypothetical protein Q9Q40_11000 [Acidobacteriota bacterium]|nr:hypothetical protein [Acidobacteriota bacterium]
MSRLLLPRRSGGTLVRRARPGDLLLAPGRAAPDAPPGVRVIHREEVADPAALDALSRAAVAGLRAWIGACGEDREAVEALVGAELVRLLGSLKTLLLFERVVAITGFRGRILAARSWPGLDVAVELVRQQTEGLFELSLGDDRPPVSRRLVAALRQGRGRSAPGPQPAGAAPSAEGGVWAMVTTRGQALCQELEAGGLALHRWFPGEENRYLPGIDAPDPATLADLAAAWERGLQRLATHPFAMPSPWPRTLPAGRCLEAWLRRTPPDLARFVADHRTWRRLLRENRPSLVLGPPPWAGDLRALAYACRAEGVAYVTSQDGAMSFLGQGGLLPAGPVLAWGPAGRRWFIAQGFDEEHIAEVGDPYLERWLQRVRHLDAAAERRRLQLSEDRRWLLTGLQNSAPHCIAAEEDDPLLGLEAIAATVSRCPSWGLVVKPHPRLRRVDGAARLEQARGICRSHGAIMVPADTDTARLAAATEAYLGEGDTLGLEMLAAGRAFLVWHPPGRPAPYPEFEQKGLPVARSLEQLASWLENPHPGGSAAVLNDQIAAAEPPAHALARWSRP